MNSAGIKATFLGALFIAASAQAKPQVFSAQDIFNLEYASAPIVTPDGERIIFHRRAMDIYSDKVRSTLWSVKRDGSDLTPLTSGDHQDYGTALSPDGKKLAFISNRSKQPQIYMLWRKNGRIARISNLEVSPGNLSWSPDGRWLAFSAFVKAPAKSPVSLPAKPEGAEWAPEAKVYDDVVYRADGAGYAEPGYSQIFVMSSDGGAARQITQDNFDHGGSLAWRKDSRHIVFSANRNKKPDLTPLDSNLFQVDTLSGAITQLTQNNGPDFQPKISPKGKRLAYLSYRDQLTNYENVDLIVASPDGENPKNLTAELDRSVDQIAWAKDGKGVYLRYTDRGETVLAYQSLSGRRNILSRELGGLSIGRPYVSGEFDVGPGNLVAFTHGTAQRPAELAIHDGRRQRVLTRLSEAALRHKAMGKVEAFSFKSSADNRDIDGWLVYPPEFDPSKKYPLLLEIHGGPVAAYGPHFAAELQLFAAAGYVALYINPRGSSSYGREFAQTIHHNYPSQDFDDLMSGVDAVIAKGFIDAEQLFVTGGSGGGVLTSWIIGHTDRFRAAAVVKPVINWYSFVLTADYYPFFYQYWFGKKPWEDLENYMRRSPISHVGKVKTPTLLMTGEEDYRTPISETEQFYQALKIQEVDTAMVRIPGAGHSIARRPSHLITKVAHILWWFEKYSPAAENPEEKANP